MILAYEFGTFRLLLTERLLLHDQEVVPLKPRVFDTLVILIQNRGHIMGKDELMQALWPDSFVEENSLVQNISLVRKALAQGNSTQRFVETIPKRGYRFVADVKELNAESNKDPHLAGELFGNHKLYVHDNDREAKPTEVGRTPDPQIRPDNHPDSYPVQKPLILAALILSGLGIAGVFITFRAGGSGASLSTPPQQMLLRSLTSLGKAVEGAVSPDGKYIAYVLLEEGRQSLWVKQVETNSSIRIVPPEMSTYIGLTFSPDGNHVFYTTYPENSNIGFLFQVSVLGGTKRLILGDIDSPVSFSPNGKELAFLRRHVSSNLVEHTLIIAGVDGQNQRRLSTRTGPEYYSSHGPAWSPDGKSVVTGAGTIKDVHIAGLVEINIDDGRERSITSRTWKLVERVAWLSDRSGLIVVAAEPDTERLMQIWHVSYPGGETRRVTKDLNHYRGVSLSSDSTKLVTVQSDSILSVLVSSDGNATNAKELTLASGGRLCGLVGLTTTPDHRIVYSSTTGDNTDIWIMNNDGTEQKRLTYDDAMDFLPSVSPDGKRIVFLSNRTGTQQLWTMDIDGYNQTQLADGSMKYRPRWSPDGKWIVFSAIKASETKPTVWKISSDGGEPLQLTKKYSRIPVVSPDGLFIACYYWEDSGSKMKVAIIPIDGGEPVKMLETPDGKHHWSLQWTADGRGLLHVQAHRGSATIWRLPLSGGPNEKILDVQPGQIIDFALSRDGKQFVYTRAVSNNDVVAITGFR